MKNLIIALALALVPTFAAAAEPENPAQLEWAMDVAARHSQIDAALAPIRSDADLRAHLKLDHASPLHRLSPAARSQFVRSLVFTPKGLGSYSFLPLEEGLSVTDAYRLLSLFGAQSSIATIRNLHPATEAEAAMLDVSDISTMAAMPGWRHGICVVNGGSRRCVRQYGSNCSRACD